MSTIAWKGVNSCIFWRTKSKFTPVTPRIHRNLLAILNCPPCSLRLHSRIYVPWSLSKNERKTAWQPGRHLLEFIAVILWNASCIHAKLVEPRRVPADHLLLDSALNLGPLISRWEINKFENCSYKSVRILEVLKFLFQQFMNLSSSQRDMSGPILGALSNNRWSGGT